jgi:hypothetical protein
LGFLEELLEKGWSQQYGARHLNRIIQNNVITPISKMMSSDQLIGGDIVDIDFKDEKFQYFRRPRTKEQLLSWKVINDQISLPDNNKSIKSNGGAIKVKPKRGKGKSIDAK